MTPHHYPRHHYKHPHFKPRHRPRHPQETYVMLIVEVGCFPISSVIEEQLLTPNGVNTMNPVTVSVGHTVNCTIVFLDQSGNPMVTTPTPDAVPTWSDTTPATGTLTASASGLTAAEAAIAPGTDTISVNLSVNSVAFTASVPILVAAAPQVLTSIQIATTVQ